MKHANLFDLNDLNDLNYSISNLCHMLRSILLLLYSCNYYPCVLRWSAAVKGFCLASSLQLTFCHCKSKDLVVEVSCLLDRSQRAVVVLIHGPEQMG